MNKKIIKNRFGKIFRYNPREVKNRFKMFPDPPNGVMLYVEFDKKGNWHRYEEWPWIFNKQKGD